MIDDIDAPLTTEEKLEYELGFAKNLTHLSTRLGRSLMSAMSMSLYTADNDLENMVKNLQYHCHHMVTIHHEMCIALGDRRDDG